MSVVDVTLFTGVWEGVSTPHKEGEVTVWSDCKLTFDANYKMRGKGQSVWRGQTITFRLVGDIDATSLAFQLYKTHEGKFTNTVLYHGQLDYEHKSLRGEYRSGSLFLSKQRELPSDTPSSPPVPSPTAPPSFPSPAALPSAVDSGGGVSGSVSSASSSLPTPSLSASLHAHSSSSSSSSSSGSSTEPVTAQEMWSLVESPMVFPLCGVWQGESIKSDNGEVTRWNDTRLWFFPHSSTDAAGHIQGAGVSIWRGQTIPFSVEGTFDAQKLMVVLTKIHLGKYNNRLTYNAHIVDRSLEREGPMMKGDYPNGVLSLEQIHTAPRLNSLSDVAAYLSEAHEPYAHLLGGIGSPQLLRHQSLPVLASQARFKAQLPLLPPLSGNPLPPSSSSSSGGSALPLSAPLASSASTISAASVASAAGDPAAPSMSMHDGEPELSEAQLQQAMADAYSPTPAEDLQARLPPLDFGRRQIPAHLLPGLLEKTLASRNSTYDDVSPPPSLSPQTSANEPGATSLSSSNATLQGQTDLSLPEVLMASTTTSPSPQQVAFLAQQQALLLEYQRQRLAQLHQNAQHQYAQHQYAQRQYAQHQYAQHQYAQHQYTQLAQPQAQPQPQPQLPPQPQPQPQPQAQTQVQTHQPQALQQHSQQQLSAEAMYSGAYRYFGPDGRLLTDMEVDDLLGVYDSTLPSTRTDLRKSQSEILHSELKRSQDPVLAHSRAHAVQHQHHPPAHPVSNYGQPASSNRASSPLPSVTENKEAPASPIPPVPLIRASTTLVLPPNTSPSSSPQHSPHSSAPPSPSHSKLSAAVHATTAASAAVPMSTHTTPGHSPSQSPGLSRSQSPAPQPHQTNSLSMSQPLNVSPIPSLATLPSLPVSSLSSLSSLSSSSSASTSSASAASASPLAEENTRDWDGHKPLTRMPSSYEIYHSQLTKRVPPPQLLTTAEGTIVNMNDYNYFATHPHPGHGSGVADQQLKYQLKHSVPEQPIALASAGRPAPPLPRGATFAHLPSTGAAWATSQQQAPGLSRQSTLPVIRQPSASVSPQPQSQPPFGRFASVSMAQSAVPSQNAPVRRGHPVTREADLYFDFQALQSSLLAADADDQSQASGERPPSQPRSRPSPNSLSSMSSSALYNVYAHKMQDSSSPLSSSSLPEDKEKLGQFQQQQQQRRQVERRENYAVFLSALLISRVGDKLSKKQQEALNDFRTKHGITDEDHLHVLRTCELTASQFDDMKDAESDGDVCKICFDKPIDCVILPCGHFTACMDCVKKLDKCPVCRGEKKEAKHIFRS